MLHPAKLVGAMSWSFVIIGSLIIFILIGSLIVFLFLRDSRHWKKPDSEDLTLLDCIYYHFVSVSTIGYGAITPITTEAKIYTILIAIAVMFNIFSKLQSVVIDV